MDYFWLKSDKRYLQRPVITNLKDIVYRKADMSWENAHNIADIHVGFARSDEQLDYIDILDSQLFLVRDTVKQVFAMYEPSLEFKAVCILNNKDGTSCNYHAPLFMKVDCLPEEYKPVAIRSRLDKLVLLEEAIQDYGIFKIADIDTDIIIIRLDVAESLLRRGSRKLVLERVILK